MTAARLGQAERAPAAGFFGLDQPLVSKLLQGGVDSARAGPPGATAALFYLGHDLVPVARALAPRGNPGDPGHQPRHGPPGPPGHSPKPAGRVWRRPQGAPRQPGPGAL